MKTPVQIILLSLCAVSVLISCQSEKSKRLNSEQALFKKAAGIQEMTASSVSEEEPEDSEIPAEESKLKKTPSAPSESSELEGQTPAADAVNDESAEAESWVYSKSLHSSSRNEVQPPAGLTVQTARPEQPESEPIDLETESPKSVEDLIGNAVPDRIDKFLAEQNNENPDSAGLGEISEKFTLQASTMPVSQPHKGSPGGLTASTLKIFQCRTAKQDLKNFSINILGYRVNQLGSHPLCEILKNNSSGEGVVVAYAKYERRFCDNYTVKYMEEIKNEYECEAVIHLQPGL